MVTHRVACASSRSRCWSPVAAIHWRKTPRLRQRFDSIPRQSSSTHFSPIAWRRSAKDRTGTNRDIPSAWRSYATAQLRGTPIGQAPYEAFFGPPPPVDVFKANPNIEDHYDAVLVLGTPSSMRLGRLGYPRCAEPDYVRMRVTRMTLSGMPPSAERLAKECAAAAPR